ncbi:hypothetical protein KSD_86990 [Ktedonobacter sp. SOSP1-85]|uniref:DUF1648 domain-containing protein n=1 Tax=Ktedonobacter sp. SOSP1-85 TaxID=2778367 RepID=UPI00191575FA|nr:DUF1648 domain-containing protein [Ktedonobacter sp. SOSP1-85]GHO80928.1 hypothetical protein KSD_86990 [Ktedonobacter sp. SOSP1-85]
MNNPSRTSDKILPRPNPGWRNSTNMLIWAIIVLQLLIALFAYPFLPATVPIHWSGGHANSYGPKWMATFLFPGISLLVWFLRVRQATGPHLGSRIDEATNVQWRSLLPFSYSKVRELTLKRSVLPASSSIASAREPLDRPSRFGLTSTPQAFYVRR